MTKTYVIDTNVIMQDPHCIGKIDGDVFITTTVLEELDKHKSDNNEVGRNCREFARVLENIDNLYPDKVNIAVNSEDAITNDIKIVLFTKNLDFPDVILLTNDLMMRAIARAHGVKSEGFSSELVKNDELYSGVREFSLSMEDLSPNEYVVGGGIIEKFSDGCLSKIPKDRTIFGISHKNLEQRCVIDALMNDDIKLVTICGKSGSGKTLLSLAAGLEKTMVEKKYNKILVSRPTISMGEEIGFLPGDETEKLSPWMRPISDNLQQLFKSNDLDIIKQLEQNGLVSFQAITFLRGRSIPNEFILIDECQNLSKHVIKGILTRAGHNTKIVLVGDIEQIDDPKLDSVNNGLSYVINKFKDQKIASHITLKKTERSELADIASTIL